MNDAEYKDRISKIEKWTEELRAELTQKIPGDPPRKIFHYTDTHGVLGIVESGVMRATHVSRLNDSSEYAHGMSVVSDAVRLSKPPLSNQLADDILDKFNEVDTFVASYSAEENVLSQWRSYSGSQTGYCLGFAANQMATTDGSAPLLEPVIYQDATAGEVVTTLIHRIGDYFDQNQWTKAEAGFLLGWTGKMLLNLACMIKHHSFLEEKELRQFYQPGGGVGPLSKKFRVGQFGLTPYVEFPFQQAGRLPLESIMIGPCRDPDSEGRALRSLLDANEYDDVEISVSSIPLRT